MNRSEVEARADFSSIRYAQCWEDADILLEALDVRPGDTCVSIASAGDNALSLLARGPKRVVAVDLNPAQIACLELRVAAYRTLNHGALLELVGSRVSGRRRELFMRCRKALSRDARAFWEARLGDVDAGIGAAGRFERYFRIFAQRVLPWVHDRRRVERLLSGGDRRQREHFYESVWNNRRWRIMFRLFFSRWAMARLGRDPAFFRYVQGSVADHVMARTRHALTRLDPRDNPYLQWILTGTHTDALPHALRPENFDAIRDNLDRLEWRMDSLETVVDTLDDRVDCYNLSDIFEYMSEANYHHLLRRLVDAARCGSRLVYWNMLVPRGRPDAMADVLATDPVRNADWLARDKAFFYSAFVREEVL